jgi:hypothetical protein
LGLFLFRRVPCVMHDAARPGGAGGIVRRVIKSRQFKDLPRSSDKSFFVFWRPAFRSWPSGGGAPAAGPAMWGRPGATHAGPGRPDPGRRAARRPQCPTISGISASDSARGRRGLYCMSRLQRRHASRRVAAWRTPRSATRHPSFTEFHGDPQRRQE